MYEVAALRLRDETLHEEEWPLFMLKEACVTLSKRGTHQLVDLLEVSLKGPFRVRGRLQPVKKEQEHLVLQRQVFNQDIIITSVWTYSMEAKEDGSLIIWVLGNCGWYAISPSAEYDPLFRQVVEKARLWLWLEEKYPPEVLQSKKKMRDTLQTLCLEFAEDHPEWPTLAAAEGLIIYHHKWLILKMTEGIQNGIDWTRTSLYQELFRRYENVFGNISRAQRSTVLNPAFNEIGSQATTAGTSGRPIASPTLSKNGTRTTLVTSGIKELINKKAKSATASSIATKAQKSYMIHRNSKSYALFQFIEKHFLAHEIRPESATVEFIIDVCFEKFDWINRQTAAEVIKARSEDLRISMHNSSQYPWKDAPAFQELQNMGPPNDRNGALRQRLAERSMSEFGDQPAVSANPSTPSKDSTTATEERDSIEEEEDLDSESEEEEDTQPKSSKGKSVLRPRFFEITGGEMSSPLASHTAEDIDIDEENISIDESSNDSLSHGLSRSKHGYEEEADPEKITKRLRTLHAQSKEPESKFGDTDWPNLVLGKGKPPVIVGQLPPTTANCGDIWLCPIQGCNERVLETNTVQGRKLVEAHYEKHGRAMQQAMEVIGTESEGRSVDHLLAKIESMAQDWARTRPKP